MLSYIYEYRINAKKGKSMRAIFKGLGKVMKVVWIAGFIAVNFVLDCVGVMIRAITKG